MGLIYNHLHCCKFAVTETKLVHVQSRKVYLCLNKQQRINNFVITSENDISHIICTGTLCDMN